jgi:hypothetical protein
MLTLPVMSDVRKENKLTFAIQELEREINDLECSSENFLQRSSQLTTMISLMSINEPLMKAVDFTDSKEPSSQGENIGATSAELPVEQPVKASKPTKLQEIMADRSIFSSKFVPEVMKREANEQNLDVTANTSHSTPVNQVEHFQDSTSHYLEQGSQIIDKSLHFAKDSISSLGHLGEVSDGPSQRAASLLLSRSSHAAFQTPENTIRRNVSVKMQHWNGAELCDDPYASKKICCIFEIMFCIF